MTLDILSLGMALAVGIGLGLLTGLIQAYIFAILAMVYITSATRAHHATATDTMPDGADTPEEGSDTSQDTLKANASSRAQHEKEDR